MKVTATVLAVAVILLGSNFTIINAQPQQQMTGPAATTTTTAGGTTFQSTNDSFSIRVPDGWVVHDVNNTGSAITEEARLGYGMLAQLCPEEGQQQQQGGSVAANASGSSDTGSCDRSGQDIIYIIRYPDLDIRLAASNVTANNDTATTDDLVGYHLQKLQEVGYRSMQIVNRTDVTLNLTNPQTDETLTTLPAKFVEMTYSTNITPNEIRRGYFISTFSNETTPNMGTTKGYAIFYEGNSTTSNTPTAGITRPSVSILPPPDAGQVLNSFELIAAPEFVEASADGDEDETAQAVDFEAEDEDDGAGDGDDDDGAGDDEAEDEDDGAGDGDDDDGAGDGDDDGGNEGSGDCVVVGLDRDVGDVCDDTADDSGDEDSSDNDGA
jgi:hypothetical protein